MASPLDPASLNLKVGFEIHQQLATKSKLFCNCSCEEAKEYDSSFVRKLRPTQSELGAYDPAAMFESSKMHIVKYQAALGSSCLVEDAAKLIGEEKGVRKFGLDRLGVPLVEIALEPVTGRPSEIMQVALTLGRLLRASKRVARGLG